MKSAAANLKNITLETGGKSPLLVFEDADLELATTWAFYGLFSNSGQICTATSRIIVQESIYDKFIEGLKKMVLSTAKIGDGFGEGVFQGPQISKIQYDKVLAYLKSGKEEGATVVMGGEADKSATADGKGYFVQPTIFGKVKDNMKVYREEVRFKSVSFPISQSRYSAQLRPLQCSKLKKTRSGWQMTQFMDCKLKSVQNIANVIQRIKCLYD
jgi:aldehyde dehydrogenase (NAD+)